MDYKTLTEEYYSLWLANDIGFLKNNRSKINFIYCEERNKTLKGYSCPYDLIVWFQGDKYVISYGEKAKSQIHLLKRDINSLITVDDFSKRILDLYGKESIHHIKFLYTGKEEKTIIAKELRKSDYLQYLSFFKELNPTNKSTDWVWKYFEDMLKEHLCCGVFENEKLVSCTDAPTMPYLGNKIQEIGINTLLNYRGKGYAEQSCQLCIKNIIENGKCPIWSCSNTNIASIKLAKRLGFKKIADFLTLTI